MPSLIKRYNGIYYAIFSWEGKRIWRSTGMKNENQAREILGRLSQQYLSRRTMTVLEFCETLIELLEGTLRPTTILLYKQTLTKFAAVVSDLSLKSIQPYHIDLFKARRLKQVSPVKVSIDFRTLRSALNHAVRFRMIEKNPAA